MKFFILCSLGLLWAAPVWGAALTESTFSQVVKDVKVVSRATETTTSVKVNDVFKSPDLIRTGTDSLAELVAADKTITRVGANTVFSFEKAGRAINLEQGSVLFHSPKGKGGGTIKTKGASAAVLGTTIVVTATAGGGFKAIVLEGKGQITLPNGNFRILQAGQVTFVLPGAQQFGPQLNINLQKLVESSRLVQGFETELPSKPVIQRAIERQQVLIRAGLAQDTGILVANQATADTVAVLDPTLVQQAVEERRDEIALARAADATISSSDLRPFGTGTPKQLFLDPTRADLPLLGVLNFSGLLAKNITIKTAAIDFTSFLGQTDFTLAADNTMTIQSPPVAIATLVPDLDLFASPMLFVGTPALASVSFVARNHLNIEDGFAIRARHLGDVSFIAGAAMTLNSVQFENNFGKLELNGKAGLTVNGGGIAGQSLLVNGSTVDVVGGNYSATASAVFSGYGSTLNTDGTSISGATVSLQAQTDSDLHSTTVNATTLANLTSSRDVRVGGGSFSASTSSGTLQVSAQQDIFAGSSAQFIGKTVQMNAGRNLSLNNVNAGGFTMLNVTAANNLAVTSGSFTGASGASANLTSTGSLGELSMNGTSFAGVPNIALSAATIVLSFVDFPSGSTVNLSSLHGRLADNPNTGASVTAGFVNYINGVSYGGVLLTASGHPNVNIGRRP
jgi:hypothetical protein